MFVQQCGHSSGDPIDLKHSQKPTRLCLLSVKLCINNSLARGAQLPDQGYRTGWYGTFRLKPIWPQNSLKQCKSFVLNTIIWDPSHYFSVSVYFLPHSHSQGPWDTSCERRSLCMCLPECVSLSPPPDYPPSCGSWSIAVNAWVVRITSGQHTDTPTHTAGSQSRHT